MAEFLQHGRWPRKRKSHPLPVTLARVSLQFRPHHLAWFAGGIIPTNAMPHLIIGVSDSTFQISRSRPPRRRPATGLLPSTINVLWGAVSLRGRVCGCALRRAASTAVFKLCLLAAVVALTGSLSRMHGDNAATPPRSGAR